MISELEVNATAPALLGIRQQDLASNISQAPQDILPPVFATAYMATLMEMAVARIFHLYLQPDELSVGVSVTISHPAATPLGIPMTANAQYVGREGQLFVFEAWVKDAGGEIGRGIYKRAAVVGDRLLSGAKRRNSQTQS